MTISINTWVASDHKFGMQDADWRQVVYDHRAWLKEKSTLVSFTMPDANYWKFRLMEYLKSAHNYSLDAEWIVFYINELDNKDFDGGTMQLYVPGIQYIEQLYSSYQQNTNIVR